MRAAIKWQLLGLAALALAGFGALFVASLYVVHLLVSALTFAVVAISWNLLLSTGQISLGHAAFFGVGAYTTGLGFERLGWSPWLGLPLAAVTSAAVAVLLGMIVMRMRGIYLAITTLAFAEGLRVVFTMLPGLTGGAAGLTMPPLFGGDRVANYLFAVALVVVALGVHLVVVQTRRGFAFKAIRQGETAARALGVNVLAEKLYAFAISAAMTGVAGAFYGSYLSFIDPEIVFALSVSVEAQVLPLVGGLHTVTGPLVGALTLGFGTEVLREYLEQAHLLVYGLLLVVFVLWLPRGLVGTLASWRARRAARSTAPPGEHGNRRQTSAAKREKVGS